VLAGVTVRKAEIAWGNIDSYLIFRLTAGAVHATDRSQALAERLPGVVRPRVEFAADRPTRPGPGGCSRPSSTPCGDRSG